MSDVLDALRDAQIEVLRELERVKGREGRFERVVALRDMDAGLTALIRHYKYDGWGSEPDKAVEQDTIDGKEEDSDGESI